MTIFRVCGNGDYGVCYVSQNEEISTRAPRFCVAYQAPHAVARDGTHVVAAEAPHAVAIDGTHASLELDHMRSPQTGARARAPRLPPIELDTKGQALHRATPSTNGSARSARRRDGTHAVAAEAPHAVAADETHAVAGDGTHAVAADGTYAVAGDGSHKVTADRRARACAAATARRARRQGPGPPRTAPRVPHAGGEKKLQSFYAPSHDSPALP
ncbi:hypothetical protein TrCOL_g2419 [Triparma columacea]|uniref:Uncharacterized protein n=1 Tax=Triparma columacea TaxID=722753 RepID=A0A9W7FWQ9_9STRA|nr:hypothetical protein TrCOL_g2419 [Triparma columacea]